MQINQQNNENTLTNTSNNSTSTTNSRNIISQEDYKSDYDYNNYYTHGAARFMAPEQCEAIKTAYIDNVGDVLPGAVAHMIERAYTSGLTSEEIVMAIEETGFAPRPSPWYLKKILENWVENGVTVSRIRHAVSPNRALPWWK